MMDQLSQTKGYVYILINPSMPNLLKIGKSTRSPETRAMELSQATGVPYSFQVAYQTLVDDCDVAEKEIHNSLNTYRTKKNREFFRIPLNQAIDLFRKVVADKGLKSSNLDIEPYKFVFEEFNSPESLFSFILSDEDKWEQAKLHLKDGYLEGWLKKKDEYDALINIEKYSGRSEEQDFFLSLISFSIVPTKFRLFGYGLESLSSLYNECQDSPTNERLIDLLLSGKLLEMYEGYLKATRIEDDKILKWLRFVDKSKVFKYEIRRERILKMLEWKLFPSRFLHFDKMTFEKAEFLKEKSQWLYETSQIYVPKEILDNALSKNEEKVKSAIRKFNFLKKLIRHFRNPEKRYSHFDKNISQNEMNDVVSCVNPFHNGKELSADEYLSFINGILSKKDILEISNSYILPSQLADHLTKNGRFIDFLYAIEILRFLLLKDTSHLFPETVKDLPYEFILLEIRRKYEKVIFNSLSTQEKERLKDLFISIIFLNEKYQSGILSEEEKEDKYIAFKELNDQWDKLKTSQNIENGLSYWEYASTREKMQSFLMLTRKYWHKNKETENIRGRLIRKVSLELEIEKCIQDCLISIEEKKLLKADSYRYLSQFEFSNRPKIYKINLEDRLIPLSLVEGLKSPYLNDYMVALDSLYNMFLKARNIERKNLKDYQQYQGFHLKLFPTKEFIKNLIIPKELVERLVSQDVEIYSNGIFYFLKYKEYLLPKKVFYALKKEFILPEEIESKISGNCIEEYFEALKILSGWGLVNGVTSWCDFFGVEGFHSGEENHKKYAEKFNKNVYGAYQYKGYKEEYKVYSDGWVERHFPFPEAKKEVSQNLKRPEVKMTLTVNKRNNLITKQDLQSYLDTIGEGGAEYFYSFSKITTSNYLEIFKIIEKRYDKRLDEVIEYLLKEIPSKLSFLQKELIEILINYLEVVVYVKLKMSKADNEFILSLKNYTKESSLSIYFKKRKIIEFLKENYGLYREKLGSSLYRYQKACHPDYLFDNAAWKKRNYHKE